MLTNVYLPQVGGITRSIQAFTEQFRQRGHDILIVAPSAEGGQTNDEMDHVVRFPAISHAYQNRYSLPLPVPGYLHATFESYEPDVVHSHHPFLIGQVARRGATLWDVPLVYTHHTRYDAYLKAQSRLPASLVKVLAQLWINYCQLCEAVIAPSQSIASLLREHGVTKAIEVIPTGVEVEVFGQGDGAALRQRLGIPGDAFIVGHVGRLAPEKNCRFLAEAVGAYLKRVPNARFLLAGEGPLSEEIAQVLQNLGVKDRYHHLGMLEKREVVNVYHAMDVFAFSSHSETQGMVLTEAMAAGTPVVAVAASGVNDVLRDEVNGRLLPTDDVSSFADALEWVSQLNTEPRQKLHAQARQTAEQFSISNCAERALALYKRVVQVYSKEPSKIDGGAFATLQRIVEHEMEALVNALGAVGQSFLK